MMDDMETMTANHDAERAILGSILIDNERFHEAAAELSPSHFHLDSHRRLFAAMYDLSAEGKAVDMITLLDHLGGRRELEAVGGAGYISSLTDGVPHMPSIAEYVGITRDKSKRRELLRALERGISYANDPTESTDKCLELIQDALLDIEADSNKTKAQHVNRFTTEVFDSLAKMRKSNGEIIGLSTGISRLDSDTTGVRPGELWVIGGRAGEGKSSLALQIAMANTENGTPTAIFSIEMSKDQILQRAWAAESGVEAWKIRDPRRMNPDEWARATRTALKIAEQPLYIDDSSSLTTTELAARARLLIKQHKVELIIVDYVQIIDGEGRDERQRVTRISKALRQLAKDENVGVIALSQLTRPRDGDTNRRPTKFDLKESGSLEADAHTVILIYRPTDNFNEFTGDDELIIGKQRNGPVKAIKASYDTKALFFRERE